MFVLFRDAFREYPVISVKEIQKIFPGFDSKNLVRWQKKGYVTKLRNGFYLLKETKMDEAALFIIANQIYSPSYVSLESALEYHSIIPEAVYRIQSVSTRKTNSFETPIGTFDYHTLKPSLFFGYQLQQKNGIAFKIASKEKAILDFLYLRSDINNLDDMESLRWNKERIKQLDMRKLKAYLRCFNSVTLNRKIQKTITN